jgi:hypothetical protein
MGSDYTAMERSTSQSGGGKLPFVLSTPTSKERRFATFMALIQTGPSRYGLKRTIVDIRWGLVEFTPMTTSGSSLALGWTHTHGP